MQEHKKAFPELIHLGDEYELHRSEGGTGRVSLEKRELYLPGDEAIEWVRAHECSHVRYSCLVLSKAWRETLALCQLAVEDGRIEIGSARAGTTKPLTEASRRALVALLERDAIGKASRERHDFFNRGTPNGPLAVLRAVAMIGRPEEEVARSVLSHEKADPRLRTLWEGAKRKLYRADRLALKAGEELLSDGARDRVARWLEIQLRALRSGKMAERGGKRGPSEQASRGDGDFARDIAGYEREQFRYGQCFATETAQVADATGITREENDKRNREKGDSLGGGMPGRGTYVVTNSKANSCDMEVREPARPLRPSKRATAKTLRSARRTRSYEEGSRLRSLWRMATDGVVFGRPPRTQRKGEGSIAILLDMSGSMSLSSEQIVELCAASTRNLTLAGYCSDEATGRLTVFSRDGTMVNATKELLNEARIGCGNGCDEHALQWLMDQKDASTRIWVSDGGVTGRGDSAGASVRAACAAIFKASRTKQGEAGIRRVGSTRAAIAFLEGSQPLEAIAREWAGLDQPGAKTIAEDDYDDE